MLACLLALSACDQGAPAPVAARDDAAPALVPVDAAIADVALDTPVDASPPPPPSYRNLTFLTEESCLWLTVGPGRERASICTEIDENLWRVTRRVMRVSRNGTRETILDVSTKIEGFDTGHNALESRIRFANDGMSVVVESLRAGSKGARYPYHHVNEPVADCDARRRRSDHVEAIPDAGPSYGVLRDRQCADVGRYVWNGDRFTRESAP